MSFCILDAVHEFCRRVVLVCFIYFEIDVDKIEKKNISICDIFWHQNDKTKITVHLTGTFYMLHKILSAFKTTLDWV